MTPRLVVLQLSDFHIVDENAPILGRVEAIAAAIRELLVGVSHCVIVLNGDTAFSGGPEQFLLAFDFVSTLQNAIARAAVAAIEIKVITVPGNHDCDFSPPQEARDRVISTFKDGGDLRLPDASVADLLTNPLKEYFAFEAAVGFAPAARSTLYSRFDVDVAGKRVVFHALNSAWLSTLHETPGSKYFPLDVLPNARGSEDLSIAVLHHPYGWFHPDALRPFRKCLEGVADIILTGHEHDHYWRKQEGARGERNEFIEAHALWDTTSGTSGFTVLCLDLGEQKERILGFSWTGSMYESPDRDTDWEEYQVTRILRQGHFDFTPGFVDVLTDPGVAIRHPVRGDLSLSDLFVYPDLREIPRTLKDSSRAVPGEALLKEVAPQSFTVLVGGEKAGKTCFAKQLVLDSHEAGCVPVLLDGAEIRSGNDVTLQRVVDRAVSAMYGAECVAPFAQLPRKQRVLIIDDYHEARVGGAAAERALSYLRDSFGAVIVFASDLTLQLTELAKGSRLSDLMSAEHFRMTPLGYARRDQLAEKWLMLDPKVADEPGELARRLHSARSLMEIAVGKNVVPSYPVFIWPMLQAQDATEPANLNASTYGYFYELLIKAALAQQATKESFDVSMSYLAELCFGMFERNISAIPESDLIEFHRRFTESRKLRIEFTAILGELLRARILHRREDGYAAKYLYVFYYFVAKHLADTINEASTQDIIKRLAADVANEVSANILLFLAHLQKHPVVFQSLLEQATAMFEDDARAEFISAELPKPPDGKSLPATAFSDQGADKNRSKALAEIDGDDEVNAATSAYLERVRAAFRTIQILGQILKNFPGSLSGETKMLLTDACYGVGLRVLGNVLKQANAHGQAIIDDTMRILRNERPQAGEEELRERAQESLFSLTVLAAYGMIKRVASSVGSPQLQPIFDELLERHPTPAVKLITAALRLDQQGELPSDYVLELGVEFGGHPAAHTILRRMVITRFHLFDDGFKEKQRLCEKLGISYHKLQAVNPTKRLVGPAEPKP